MPQSKILVDTNTYLRLAKTIRPLLFVPFGDNEHCLYILPELNEELKSRKLQSKFHWVEEDEFVNNRMYFPKVSKKQKSSIQRTYEYLWDYVQDNPGPSTVDTLYVSYAIELGIPVVTDDRDMSVLAKEFDAQVISTIELLKIMFDSGHADLKTINGLCGYLRYWSDFTPSMESDYQRLFGDH
jgi:hypothetical protein